MIETKMYLVSMTMTRAIERIDARKKERKELAKR